MCLYYLVAQNRNQTNTNDWCSSEIALGDPYGNRTHVFALRGRRLSRLTNRPFDFQDRVPRTLILYHIRIDLSRAFLKFLKFFLKNLFPSAGTGIPELFFEYRYVS